MRKSIRILLMMLILLSFATISKAANVNLSLSPAGKEVERGAEIKVSVNVSNFGREGTQNAIEGKLNYASTNLEFKQAEGKNGWSITMSTDKTGFVARRDGAVSNNEAIAEITFKAKEDAALGKTSITLEKVITSADGDEVVAEVTNTEIGIIAKTASDDDKAADPENKDDGNKPAGSEKEDDGNKAADPEKKDDGNKTPEAGNSTDGSKAKKEYPNTGIKEVVAPIAIVFIFSVITFIGYRKYKAF